MSSRRFADPKVDHNLDDLTRAELRARICRRLGLHESHYSPLSKSALNSLYAYFTGEFYFPKSAYNTRYSPPTGEIRVYLAEEAPIKKYTIWPDDYENMEDGESVRAYRRAELAELVERVENTDDSRTEVTE